MQYVRSLSGSVSKTWNSINPATLSGAIDVIVIEQQDGTLACSPFHVRFGKFSLFRPSDKKVEFCVNGVRQNYAMKLGEGGEAFFVFQTTDDIPMSMQTSPVISPATSPRPNPFTRGGNESLQEPVFLDLEQGAGETSQRPGSRSSKTSTDKDATSTSFDESVLESIAGRGSAQGLDRSKSFESLKSPPLAASQRKAVTDEDVGGPISVSSPTLVKAAGNAARSTSPPPLSPKEALNRAVTLSKKLSVSNIPSHVTDSGDLMLDMTGYKSNEEAALRAEATARKILAEELEGNYDVGALMDADEQGNIWIFSSEESKVAASRRATLKAMHSEDDAVSDPGYHSDESRSDASGDIAPRYGRSQTVPEPTASGAGSSTESLVDGSTSYAKTLRLTSDQLKALNLKQGSNEMTFSVNKATVTAYMYLWSYNTPIVISDIDGTITKSDALGHVLNMIGRDWTHLGVAKLYTDIVNNGYNIMYLTSRSTGQADTTRAYLNGVSQEGYRLPKGPVIMSPDRTLAALRREVYLRKPEVFKMACLRDILSLFRGRKNPFYAGFGNRLTDALSYRSVNIPSSRIFTINSNAEVYMDLLSLNKYRSSYVSMREVVDHFFPPTATLVQEGGEQFTDFNYWRDEPLAFELSSTESEDEDNESSDSDTESENEEDQEEEEDDHAEGSIGDENFITRDNSLEFVNTLESEEQEYPSEEDEEYDDEDEGDTDGEDEGQDGPQEETTEAPAPEQGQAAQQKQDEPKTLRSSLSRLNLFER